MAIVVEPSADGDGYDARCEQCGERSRLHPQEPWVPQVQLFLAQHRHEDDDREAP